VRHGVRWHIQFNHSGLCRRFLHKAGMTNNIYVVFSSSLFEEGGKSRDKSVQVILSHFCKERKNTTSFKRRMKRNKILHHYMNAPSGRNIGNNPNTNNPPLRRCGTCSCQFVCHTRVSGHILFNHAGLCRRFLLKAGMT